MITRTAIVPTSIPTPRPILAPKDSPLDGDVVGVGLVEEEEGAVVIIMVIVVVEIEEMEVGLGFCVVSVPFTTKSPFPPLQHANALSPSQ